MEMEGKSSMAAKMDNKKKKPAPTPTLLPVSEEKKNLQQQQARAVSPPFLDINNHVQRVNQWTFLNAFVGTLTFGIVGAYTFITDPEWLEAVPRAAMTMTEAEANPVSALMVGMLWLSTPQAAAGALALLLPSHRWRLRQAAAYAALAATVASHCIFVGVVVLVFGFKIFSTMVIFWAVFDVLGFLVLLRGEWGT